MCKQTRLAGAGRAIMYMYVCVCVYIHTTSCDCVSVSVCVCVYIGIKPTTRKQTPWSGAGRRAVTFSRHAAPSRAAV